MDSETFTGIRLITDFVTTRLTIKIGIVLLTLLFIGFIFFILIYKKSDKSTEKKCENKVNPPSIQYILNYYPPCIRGKEEKEYTPKQRWENLSKISPLLSEQPVRNFIGF